MGNEEGVGVTCADVIWVNSHTRAAWLVLFLGAHVYSVDPEGLTWAWAEGGFPREDRDDNLDLSSTLPFSTAAGPDTQDQSTQTGDGGCLEIRWPATFTNLPPLFCFFFLLPPPGGKLRLPLPLGDRLA